MLDVDMNLNTIPTLTLFRKLLCRDNRPFLFDFFCIIDCLSLMQMSGAIEICLLAKRHAHFLYFKMDLYKIIIIIGYQYLGHLFFILSRRILEILSDRIGIATFL